MKPKNFTLITVKNPAKPEPDKANFSRREDGFGHDESMTKAEETRLRNLTEKARVEKLREGEMQWLKRLAAKKKAGVRKIPCPD